MTASILDGVSDIFDDWLGLFGNRSYGTKPHVAKYHSKKASMELSRRGGPLPFDGRSVMSAKDAITKAMSRLENNLDNSQKTNASAANWKWEKSLHLSPKNRSPEKVMEKVVTFLFGDAWVNQIPTCNGLVPEGSSASRIDLAHRLRPKHYELIELKFGVTEDKPGSDYPLYAAMELLEYALMYMLFRKRHLLGNALGKDHALLCAKCIDLVVLAPIDWYNFGPPSREAYKFGWLEEAINQGLTQYLVPPDYNFQMHFRFEVLPAEITTSFAHLMKDVYTFRDDALQSRRALYR